MRFLTAGAGTIEYCTIEQGSAGIDVTSTGTVAITRSVIRDGSYGVKASNGTVEFLNTQIINNSTYGVYLSGGTPVEGVSGDESVISMHSGKRPERHSQSMYYRKRSRAAATPSSSRPAVTASAAAFTASGAPAMATPIRARWSISTSL